MQCFRPFHTAEQMIEEVEAAHMADISSEQPSEDNL